MKPARFPSELVLSCLFLTACAVDQKQEVQSYRAITDLGDGSPPSFTVGQELSLEQAVRLANAYNERLAIEGERYVQALAERRVRAASLLPTIDLFGDLTLREHTGAGGTNSNGTSRNNRIVSFDGGFSAQYTLLTGMSDFNSVKAAEADIRSRRWVLLDLREVLMLETARAYYAVLLADRLVKVLESSERVQQERLRDIRGRQQVGFARPLDVAQIESQASQTRVTLLDAQNALANAWSALVLLTNAEVRESQLTDGFTPSMEDEAVEPMVESAYPARQDLLAARGAADSARAEVDARIGEYYPTVRINLEWFLTRQTSPEDLDLTSLVSLNLPLFSAGRIDAQVRDAWSVFRQRVLEYSLTKRQIRRDVEIAAADLGASRRRVAELDAQVRASEEALRQAEAAYKAGLGTNLERITAQDQLLSAQLRQVREEYTLKIAALALKRAQGRLSGDLTGATGPTPTAEEMIAPESPFIRVGPAEEKRNAGEGS